MKIIVDEEGKKAVQELCDVALKVGGLQNFNSVGKILGSIVDEPPQSVEKEDAQKGGEDQS